MYGLWYWTGTAPDMHANTHTCTHTHPSLSHYRCQVTHFLTFLFAWGLCLCTSAPCPCSPPAWSASQSPETAQQQHGVHHSHLKQHTTTWSASQSPETAHNNMECITVTWNSTQQHGVHHSHLKQHTTTWSASQSPETAQQQHGVHHSHLKQHSNNTECITVTWNSTATTRSASQSPETAQQQHGVHHSHLKQHSNNTECITVTWNSTATTRSASQSPETAQQQHGVHHSHLKQHSNNMECISHLKQHSNNMECITVTWNSTATTWSASQSSVTWSRTTTTRSASQSSVTWNSTATTRSASQSPETAQQQQSSLTSASFSCHHLICNTSTSVAEAPVLDSSTKQSLISRRTKFVTNLEKVWHSTDPANQFKIQCSRTERTRNIPRAARILR